MSNSIRKEAFQIAGDQLDPAGTGLRGKTAGYNLGANVAARPIVLWRDRLLTVDLYSMPGAPMYAIIYCPICADAAVSQGREVPSLKIDQRNKKIEFEPGVPPKIPGFSTSELVKYLGAQSAEDIAGRLSIETFGCSWEAEPTLRRQFGLGVCNWRVTIDNNVARDV